MIRRAHLTEHDTSRELGRGVFRNMRLDDNDPHRSTGLGLNISVGFLDQHGEDLVRLRWLAVSK